MDSSQVGTSPLPTGEGESVDLFGGGSRISGGGLSGWKSFGPDFHSFPFLPFQCGLVLLELALLVSGLHPSALLGRESATGMWGTTAMF